MRTLSINFLSSCVGAILFLIAYGVPALADISVSSLQVQRIGNDNWAKIEITARGVRIDGECYNSCSATFSFESDFGNSRRNEIRITKGSGQTVLSDFTPDHTWPNGTIATYISSSRYISRNNREIARFTSDEQLFLGWLIANSEEIIQYAISTGVLTDRNSNHWERKAASFEQALRGRIRVLDDDIEQFPRDITQIQLLENFPTNVNSSEVSTTVQVIEARENTSRQLRDTIQPHLRDLGLYSGTVDGLIGPMTRSAILEFEREAGRLEDGYMDEGDLIVLQDAVAAKRTFFQNLDGNWFGKVICEAGLEWNATLRKNGSVRFGQGPIQFPRLSPDNLSVTGEGLWIPQTIQISGIDSYNNRFDYAGSFTGELIHASGTLVRPNDSKSCSLILVRSSNADLINEAVNLAMGPNFGSDTVDANIEAAAVAPLPEELSTEDNAGDENSVEAEILTPDETQTFSQAGARILLDDLEKFIKLNGNVYGIELVENYNSIREIKESSRWDSELISRFETFARFIQGNQAFRDFRLAQITLRLEEQQQESERYKNAIRRLVAVGSDYAVNNPFNPESQPILDAIKRTDGFEDSDSIQDLKAASNYLIETFQAWNVPLDAELAGMLVPEPLLESEASESIGAESDSLETAQDATDTLLNVFDGKYIPLGASTDQCSSQYLEENIESRSLRIENDVMYGYESNCEMTNPVQSENDGSITYDMRCSAEGNPYEYTSTLTQDGVRLDILREGKIRSLYSCSLLVEREQKADNGELTTITAFKQALISECSSLNGSMSFSTDFEDHIDLTGDGVDEVILSLSGATCSTAASYFCGANQCPVHIFQVNNDGLLNEIFVGQMYEWSVTTINETPVFTTVTNGASCGQTGADTCEINFIWNGSEMEIIDN